MHASVSPLRLPLLLLLLSPRLLLRLLRRSLFAPVVWIPSSGEIHEELDEHL
jgi:hypothetical protein